MVSRGFGRFRAALAKKDKVPNTSNSHPHPIILIDPIISKTKALSHISPADDPAPASKPSGLDQALNLIHPRPTRPSKAKLKIAPSGAIVFTPAQSQESLGSSILPVEPASQPTDSSTARPLSTPTHDLISDTAASSLRSNSFESVRSLQSNTPRGRTTEYERQRRYTFLGRHPPPLQRRSISLPRILENQHPTLSSPRPALFFGGPTNRPRPGYIKVPRFVPLEIRLNSSVALKDNSACPGCDQAQDVRERDVVPCDHCHQRFSFISSRSTRGGSEVPDPRIILESEETFPVCDTKGVVKAVGNKLKAVFGKGKENKELKTEKTAS